jgi:hypothetical protein
VLAAGVQRLWLEAFVTHHATAHGTPNACGVDLRLALADSSAADTVAVQHTTTRVMRTDVAGGVMSTVAVSTTKEGPHSSSSSQQQQQQQQQQRGTEAVGACEAGGTDAVTTAFVCCVRQLVSEHDAVVLELEEGTHGAHMSLLELLSRVEPLAARLQLLCGLCECAPDQDNMQQQQRMDDRSQQYVAAAVGSGGLLNDVKRSNTPFQHNLGPQRGDMATGQALGDSAVTGKASGQRQTGVDLIARGEPVGAGGEQVVTWQWSGSAAAPLLRKLTASAEEGGWGLQPCAWMRRGGAGGGDSDAAVSGGGGGGVMRSGLVLLDQLYAGVWAWCMNSTALLVVYNDRVYTVCERAVCDFR